MLKTLSVPAEGPKIGAALRNKGPSEVYSFFRINLGKAWRQKYSSSPDNGWF